MRKTFLFILALCATMMAWGATTVTKTVDQLATMHGWANATAYQSFTLDDVISVAAKTSSDKICTYPNGYYTSSKWYMYQGDSNGEFTISAALGYIIKTIKITYSPQNSGILSFKSGFGIAEADRIASGSSVTVDKRSATLYVGCTAASSSSTNINARITQFTVTYELVEQSLIEEFRDPVGDTLWNHSTAATTKLGTYGEWEMEGIRHTNPSNDMDKLKTKNTPGVGIGWVANPHMQTTAEGGVKALSFLWNQGATAKETNKTEKITVTVGDKTQDDTFSGTTTANRPNDRTFVFSPEVKSNATLRLEGVNGNRIVVGPITIIPYIRYTQKAQTANAADETYDATTGLINNAPAGEVTYSIVTEGAQATIDATTGVVDLSKVTIAEDITIKATYEDAYTTMNLHIDALPEPTVSFADGNAVTKDMNVKGYVNTLTKEGDGEVSYESSDETVATVDAEGVITIIGEGATTITAKVAACATYAAAKASYVLTITDPEDEALVETFERNSDGSSTADREGTYYIWKITTGARTRATDKLFNETPAIWLAGNGGASMETTIEGGVKRVGFLWNKFNKTASPVTISVTAGDITRTLTKEVKTGEAYNQNDPDLVFNSNFGVKSNAKLKIANPQNTTALQIGPIAITPYIFYTVKDTTIDMTKVATFTNDKLIDNRDDEEAIVYSIVGENDGVASINTQTGEVTASKAGTVTVQAKWGDVTTTYMLTIKTKGDVDAHFATEGKVEKVLADGSFTNAVVVTAGDATPAYTSDNTNVAEVNASTGEVTIKAIGTATITATMAGTDNYFAWEDSYTLVVRTGIEDSKKLVERFTQMPKGLISTAGGEEVEGDIDVTWLAYSTRRGTNDTIGGVGIQGNNIFTNGYIKSQAAVEGGIKYFSLNWKQWATENNCTLKLRAELGNSEYSMEKAGTGPATYEHYFFAINAGIKSNVNIALYNESYNEDGPLASNGRITFDAFEIVPYLFYADKEKLFDIADGEIPAKYTHPIINNVDAGSVTYEITGDNLGSFSTTTGEITFDESKQGTATITASWEGVTTSYTLTVTRKQDVTVSFANPTEKAIVGKDYTLQEMTVSPESTGDQSYESSDNTVAAVVEGALQIKKAGVVTITGTVAETDVYKGASATYQLVIYPSEVAPNILVEDYKTATGGLASTGTPYQGNFATWTYRNSRSKTTDNLKEGTKGFMFSHTNGDNKASSYFETTLDGGIKAVYFDWRQFTKDDNGQNLIFQIKLDGTVQKSIEYTAADELVENIQSYSYAPEMKKNGVKLTFANNAKSADGKTDVTGRIMMGPLTIVPYLFYTTKEVEMIIPAGEESATYTNDELIDNRDDAVDISYSVSEGASVNNEGTVTVSAAGEYTVTATWGDVSTTYTLKVTKAAEPDFVRDDLSVGQLITVCWENEIASVEGGTFYEILNGNISEITFQEVALPIAAGTPVIFESDGTDMKVNYGEGTYEGALNESIEIGAFVGLVRNAEIDNVEIEQGNILINNGQLRQVGEYCVLTKGHAYIKTSALSSVNNAPRMGARTIRLYNPDAAPTNLNGLNGTVKPMKVLRDGQFYIIRDTKTYNAQGIEVQ